MNQSNANIQGHAEIPTDILQRLQKGDKNKSKRITNEYLSEMKKLANAGLISMDMDSKDDSPKHRHIHEKLDVKDLTNSLLQLCNVVRYKNFGSKNLYKKTGVVCGAKNGSSLVFEPVILKNEQRNMYSRGAASNTRDNTQTNNIFFASRNKQRNKSQINDVYSVQSSLERNLFTPREVSKNGIYD